jgi:molybdate transport system substrate-binding protein
MSKVYRHRWITNASRSAVVLALLLSKPAVASGEEILVAAAASLTDVLKDLASSFHSKSKHKVKFSFGSSSSLARQIEQGAPIDVFFSADLAQINNLDKSGRLEPDTQKNLLSNQLVIIVPADSKLAISNPEDLLKSEVRKIALAEPSSVPVGIYASKYLEAEGLWERLRQRVVPVLDVRATLASVESGNVEAGFVYKTDAVVSKKVKVAYVVPTEKGPKITYPIAIVRESKRKEAARRFVEFVVSPVGKEAFKKYGFVVLD